ncbi:MAG: hypothetical protein IPO87_09165 [Flavobacteriales bacterium]|nr:hypothetical protein [Flavobacteriales bacterium]
MVGSFAGGKCHLNETSSSNENEKHSQYSLHGLHKFTGTAQEWQWMKHVGGIGHDTGRPVAEDEAGNIYVLATHDGACFIEGDTVQGSDAFIAKFDPSGTLIWLKTGVSPAGSMAFAGLVVDTVSQSLFVAFNYVVSCSMDTVTVSTGMYAGAGLSQWTYDGSCLWAKNVATSGTDLFGSRCYIRSLIALADGTLCLSGATTEFAQTFVQGIPYEYGAFWQHIILMASRFGHDISFKILVNAQQVVLLVAERRFMLVFRTVSITNGFHLLGHHGRGWWSSSRVSAFGSTLRMEAASGPKRRQAAVLPWRNNQLPLTVPAGSP